MLADASLETFRRDAFEAALPALLPRQHFVHLPATTKWFLHSPHGGPITLNRTYLARFGSTRVPLEITNQGLFVRGEQSFSFFLDSYVPNARAVRRTTKSNSFFTSASNAMTPPSAHVYLAQAPLSDLPHALVSDVPTPDLVLKAGKGDVYDASLWLGQAPTYTPLHKDPNPNLFVQLAGRKIVRLFEPRVGQGIFTKVQEQIGGNALATMRGEEMMQGAEQKALEKEVWRNNRARNCWQVELSAGDGLFIPKGYWHSVKGVGDGMIGSVNWWFR